MQRDVSQNLTDWLKTATKKLPPEVGAMVRAEIEAHYEDAVRDRRAEGLSEGEAHRAAMIDLGDERVAGRALRQAHLAPRRYILAMGLSLLYPLIHFGIPALIYDVSHSEAASAIAMELLTVPLVIYVVNVFKQLAVERFGARDLDRPTWLFIVGMVAEAFGRVMSYLLYGSQDVPALWGGAPLGVVVLDWVEGGGIFMAGLALLILGRAVLGLDGRLYGLRRMLAYLIIVDGAMGVIIALGLLAAGPAPDFHIIAILSILSVVAFGLHTIVFAVMTLLFFRAVYRPDRPMQAAE